MWILFSENQQNRGFLIAFHTPCGCPIWMIEPSLLACMTRSSLSGGRTLSFLSQIKTRQISEASHDGNGTKSGGAKNRRAMDPLTFGDFRLYIVWHHLYLNMYSVCSSLQRHRDSISYDRKSCRHLPPLPTSKI